MEINASTKATHTPAIEFEDDVWGKAIASTVAEFRTGRTAGAQVVRNSKIWCWSENSFD